MKVSNMQYGLKFKIFLVKWMQTDLSFMVVNFHICLVFFFLHVRTTVQTITNLVPSNNRNLLSHSSGGQSSISRCWQDSFLLEAGSKKSSHTSLLASGDSLHFSVIHAHSCITIINTSFLIKSFFLSVSLQNRWLNPVSWTSGREANTVPLELCLTLFVCILFWDGVSLTLPRLNLNLQYSCLYLPII